VASKKPCVKAPLLPKKWKLHKMPGEKLWKASAPGLRLEATPRSATLAMGVVWHGCLSFVVHRAVMVAGYDLTRTKAIRAVEAAAIGAGIARRE
jgi:hypothetical protein